MPGNTVTVPLPTVTVMFAPGGFVPGAFVFVTFAAPPEPTFTVPPEPETVMSAPFDTFTVSFPSMPVTSPFALFLALTVVAESAEPVCGLIVNLPSPVDPVLQTFTPSPFVWQSSPGLIDFSATGLASVDAPACVWPV